ncbi:MAG: serine/threonine-protein kinase [Polyangiaceae bacterium]
MAHDAMSLDDRARRFLFRRRIGEGAFGVVWEAYDTERGARVALKALTRTEPASLYLFKREFRALADIVHPNLVTLYELLSFGDRWFFTMELVEGADFIEHVRGMAIGPERSAGTDTVTILRSGPVGAVEIPSELTPEGLASGVSVQVLAHDWFDQPTMELSTLRGSDRPSTPIRISVAEQPLVWGGSWDGARGRAALLQLAEGLSALHDEGKLHRDIKPSNVLVTADGRVVILDFGLITELWPTGLTRDSQAVVGTPAFMSPEQSLGRPLTPATDWYSVGVMLYLGLTGRLPFDGAPLQVLIAKQRLDPPPPSTFAKDVPPDLEELCMALLARKPEERLGGEEVLRRLGTAGEAPGRARTSQPHSTFVGRGEELARLREGFSVAASGARRRRCCTGRRGWARARWRTFVRDLRRQDPDALVLAGRCFARESVPYKAIDSIIDELSLYLQQLSTTRAPC